MRHSVVYAAAVETDNRLRPQTVAFDDFDPDWANRVLPWAGLIRVEQVPEAEIIRIAPSGSVALAQYEGVLGNLEDPTLLRIVAEDDPTIPTTAFKRKNTSLHMDGYQFPGEYNGIDIAGPGNMPDCEVLAYPTVGDERLLIFAGLQYAAARLPHHLFEQLKKPVFDIANDEYRATDPNLRSGTTAVVYDDGRGMRFHVGSKIRGQNPEAEFALSALMELAHADKHFFWLKSRDVYLTWQRSVCHNGIRTRPAAGQPETVLVRRLLRLTASCDRFPTGRGCSEGGPEHLQSLSLEEQTCEFKQQVRL